LNSREDEGGGKTHEHSIPRDSLDWEQKVGLEVELSVFWVLTSSLNYQKEGRKKERSQIASRRRESERDAKRTFKKAFTLFLCVVDSELCDDESGVRGGDTALRANPIVARAAVLEVGDPGLE